MFSNRRRDNKNTSAQINTGQTSPAVPASSAGSSPSPGGGAPKWKAPKMDKKIGPDGKVSYVFSRSKKPAGGLASRIGFRAARWIKKNPKNLEKLKLAGAATIAAGVVGGELLAGKKIYDKVQERKSNEAVKDQILGKNKEK